MEFENLLQALAQGDRDAFQRFYDRYALPVYRYIFEKTGDPERTRHLWKEVFRALTVHLRKSSEVNLPLLLLTALADAQLAKAEPPTDSPELQAKQLSSELIDELHAAAAADAESLYEPSVDVETADTAAETVAVMTEEIPDTRLAENTSDIKSPDDVTEEAAADLPEASEDAADDDNGLIETPPKTVKKRRGGLIALLILLIILTAILVWGCVGLLMTYNILPMYDLGYSWFNSTVFPLFPAPF